MFWVTIRDAVGILPNAHGPIKSLEEAEIFASKLINPGIYKVLDSNSKQVSQVTIPPPAADIQRAE